MNDLKRKFEEIKSALGASCDPHIKELLNMTELLLLENRSLADELMLRQAEVTTTQDCPAISALTLQK